jgi:hypothetical protein
MSATDEAYAFRKIVELGDRIRQHEAALARKDEALRLAINWAHQIAEGLREALRC